MSASQAALAGNISLPISDPLQTPSVSGTVETPNTITAVNGGWHGTQPISFAYLWQASIGVPTTIGTSQTLALDRAYLGYQITLAVTAVNPVGSATAQVVASNALRGSPVSDSLPTISGTVSYGSVLTVSNGTWTGYPISYTYTYQWYNSSVGAISGSTASTYTLTAADVGFTVYAIVTANNGVSPNGTAQTVNTSAVTRAAYIASGSSSITGSAYIGSLLTATPPTFGGYPTPTVTYQWYNGSGAISGATASTYTIQTSDNATTIYVIVTGTNSAGSVSSTSAATATVTYPPVLADLLVVGGGGGGAGFAGVGGGGGGGAGGVLYQPISVNCLARNTPYGIVIGGGGAGSSCASAPVPSRGIAGSGSNSCFGSSYVACGGGGGGGSGGGPGGSGGGSYGRYFTSGKCGASLNEFPLRGIGTPGQGNDGGIGMAGPACISPANTNVAPITGGGGGGGAGGAGQSAAFTCIAPGAGAPPYAYYSYAGCGGSAVNYSITGTPCDYGGGGGGASSAIFSGIGCYCCYKIAGGLGGGQSGGQGARSSCNWKCPLTVGSESYLGQVPARNGVACSGGGGGGNTPSCAIPVVQCGGPTGCSGGPGVVVVAWCTSPAITYAISGVTYCVDCTTRTGYTVLNITGGSGSICFGP